MIAVDLLLLTALVLLCWRGYSKRQTWLRLIPHLIWHQCKGRSILMQLLLFGPVVVGWLLFCHWLNTAGWHATGAGCILLAMTIGLEAMRSAEERQKERNE